MFSGIKIRPAFVLCVLMTWLFLFSCGGDYPSKDSQDSTSDQDAIIHDESTEEESSDQNDPQENPSVSNGQVALTSPDTGSFLSGTVNVASSVAEDVDVSRVDFYVDQNTTPVYSSTGPPPYEFDWDTSRASNQVHTLRVEATDAYDNKIDHAVEVFVLNRNESNCPGSGSTWDLTGTWATAAETDGRPPKPIKADFIYITQQSPCDGSAFDSWGYDDKKKEFLSTSGTIFSENVYELDTGTYGREYMEDVEAWLQIDRIYWTPSENGNSFEGKLEGTLYETEFGLIKSYKNIGMPDIIITGTR